MSPDNPMRKKEEKKLGIILDRRLMLGYSMESNFTIPFGTLLSRFSQLKHLPDRCALIRFSVHRIVSIFLCDYLKIISFLSVGKDEKKSCYHKNTYTILQCRQFINRTRLFMMVRWRLDLGLTTP